MSTVHKICDKLEEAVLPYTMTNNYKHYQIYTLNTEYDLHTPLKALHMKPAYDLLQWRHDLQIPFFQPEGKSTCIFVSEVATNRSKCTMTNSSLVEFRYLCQVTHSYKVLPKYRADLQLSNTLCCLRFDWNSSGCWDVNMSTPVFRYYIFALVLIYSHTSR